MTTPSAMSGGPSSTPSSTSASASPSSMAGGSDQPSSPTLNSPDSAKQGQQQAATQQIMQIEQIIGSIAQQFPQVSQEANSAVEAVRNLLRRIVANSGQTEPAAPTQIG